MKRRTFIKAASLAALCMSSNHIISASEGNNMFGIIGKMIAVEGKRDPLISILLEGTKKMPGCINYVISRDLEDPNALWITEVWKDQESHQASLALPSVQEAIAKGKPLIAGFGERHQIEPVGGQGI